MFRRVLSRAAVPVGIASVGGWAVHTTMNDAWDEIFVPENSGPKQKIVVLGSGWAAMSAVRKLKGHEVVVISPRPHFLYTPLLAGSAVGTVQLRSVIEPVRDLLTAASVPSEASGSSFVRAEVLDVDFAKRVVRAATLDGGDGSATVDIPYDRLVIAVGAEVATFGIEGVKEHALFMKEAADADAVRGRVLFNLDSAAALLAGGGGAALSAEAEATVERLLHFVIVGGGPTGVELAAELADFCRQDVERRYGARVAERCKITLVEAMPRILGAFDAGLATFAAEHLAQQGVEICCNVAVKKVARAAATIGECLPRDASAEQRREAAQRDRQVPCGALIWVAGIAPRPLVAQLAAKLGASATSRRGLRVDDRLRVCCEGADFGTVFALGDCADSGHAPTAQVAAQQGKFMGRALRDGAESDDAAPPFEYLHAGSMAFIGDRAAIAQLAPPSAKTPQYFAWRALHGANRSPEVGQDGAQRAVTGGSAFLFWRSLYFSQLLSTSTRMRVVMDWLTVETTGRDTVLPQASQPPAHAPTKP